MTNFEFDFPVDPVTDAHPPRQIQQVTTLRTLRLYQDAIHELQARMAAVEWMIDKGFAETQEVLDKIRDQVAALRDETIQEEMEKDA